jgi:hypothetical protein
VECYARQQVATMAESLSSLAAGDVFRPEGGYGAGARLLELVLGGEATVSQVSSVDAGDEGLLRADEDVVVNSDPRDVI